MLSGVVSVLLDDVGQANSIVTVKVIVDGSQFFHMYLVYERDGSWRVVDNARAVGTVYENFEQTYDFLADTGRELVEKIQVSPGYSDFRTWYNETYGDSTDSPGETGETDPADNRIVVTQIAPIETTSKGMLTHRSPSLHNGEIAYLSTDRDLIGEINHDNPTDVIMYWDGTTTRQVVDHTMFLSGLSFHSGKISFSGIDTNSGNPALYYWNGTGVQKVSNDTEVNLISLYDGQIAWSADWGDLYYWDGAAIRKITSDPDGIGAVSLYDGKIAWVTGPSSLSSGSKIYYWDGTTTRQILDDNIQVQSLSLDNGTIAWAGPIQL